MKHHGFCKSKWTLVAERVIAVMTGLAVGSALSYSAGNSTRWLPLAAMGVVWLSVVAWAYWNREDQALCEKSALRSRCGRLNYLREQIHLTERHIRALETESALRDRAENIIKDGG